MMSTRIAAVRNLTYGYEVALMIQECPSCGVVYGIPVDLYEACRKSGERFNCPNGHSLGWSDTEADRQKRRADAAENRAAQAESAAKWQRERAEAAKRTASAYKGQATKIRNRIAAGVCPVPGCRRSGFSQVMRHIASKHPSWVVEHAHEIAAGVSEHTEP